MVKSFVHTLTVKSETTLHRKHSLTSFLLKIDLTLATIPTLDSTQLVNISQNNLGLNAAIRSLIKIEKIYRQNHILARVPLK